MDRVDPVDGQAAAPAPGYGSGHCIYPVHLVHLVHPHRITSQGFPSAPGGGTVDPLMAMPKRTRRRPQEIFSGVWIDELTDPQAPIVAKELLDTLLERLLAGYFVDDRQESEAYLKTLPFDGRIRLCYLLGLLSPEEAADLRLVGRIRDAFTHSLGERSFDDPEVAVLVERLETARQFRLHPASLGHSRVTRMRFNSAIHILARYLHFRVQQKGTIQRRQPHPPFRYAPPGELPPVSGG